MDTTGMPSEEFLAFAAYPCPDGARARGGIGGQMITSCDLCGYVNPSTAMRPHADPMFVPIVARAVVIGGEAAVEYRRAYRADIETGAP